MHRPHQNELETRLAESWPAHQWRSTHVLLAVSGGPDSVALLRAMASLKQDEKGDGKLFVAHLNHGLRGKAADEDETWLRSLCERLKVPLEVARTDVTKIADHQGDGWEAAARTARYGFLQQAAERLGARFVATGHTSDDQAETVLHRILRGTGIEGLAGIPPTRPLSATIALIRPLLTVGRRDVLEYLSSIGQDYRTDASNQDTQWTRNRLRNDLLPDLREQYNPHVDAALVRLAVQANEAQAIINGIATTVAQDCVVLKREHMQIDCNKLVEQPSIVVREILKIAWSQAGWPQQSMGFDEWQQLAALAAKSPSPCPLPKGEGIREMLNLPGNIRAHSEDGVLILEPLGRLPGFP